MSVSAADARLMLDARALEPLRQQAAENPREALRGAAQQFEALFAQMLLQQARQTSLAGDNELSQSLNSPAMKTWQGMLDQQFAQAMAGAPAAGAAPGLGSGSSASLPPGGLGLARMLETQLARELIPAEQLRRGALPTQQSTLDAARERLRASGTAVAGAATEGFAPIWNGAAPSRLGVNAAGAAASGSDGLSGTGSLAERLRDGVMTQASRQLQGAASASAAAQSSTRVSGADAPAPGSARERQLSFIERFRPAAEHAERMTGIPASFILGQAALESGWGRHEIGLVQGRQSHNLFGIKAGGRWEGDSVRSMTTEYINGRPRRMEQDFRAYPSYEAAFEDYARLLSDNSRYARVMNSLDSSRNFARALQDAGYATDIRYADKLYATIRSVERLTAG